MALPLGLNCGPVAYSYFIYEISKRFLSSLPKWRAFHLRPAEALGLEHGTQVLWTGPLTPCVLMSVIQDVWHTFLATKFVIIIYTSNRK